MSEDLPSRKAETAPETENERFVPISEEIKREHAHRAKRKVFRKTDPHTNKSTRSAPSPSRSLESDGHRKHRSFRSPKRHRQHSRSSSRSERHEQPRSSSRSRSRSPKTKPKEHSSAHKGGLVALGGLLAAGLPIAGELYLKHMAHVHERKKDERKEVRHEQAMEERERKKMDLELQAMEEETGWLSRKHEIDVRRRDVELQIKEMERNELMTEAKPNGEMAAAERGRNLTSRAKDPLTGMPKGMGIGAIDTQLAHIAPDETGALYQNIRRPRVSWQDLDPSDYQKRRWSEDPFDNPRSLPLIIPPDRPVRRHSPPPPRRNRSSSPVFRTQHRSPSPPPKRLRAFPVTTALLAGSLTAYKVRDDDGPWLGKKAARIATSAGAAVLTSFTLKRDRSPPRDGVDGLMEHIADSRTFAVAVPVMAGIGAERAVWGRKK